MKWVRHPKQCPCILEFICYGNGNDICDCDYQLTMHWITTPKKKKFTKYKWAHSIIGNHANSIATHLVIHLAEFQSLSENRIPIARL